MSLFWLFIPGGAGKNLRGRGHQNFQQYNGRGSNFSWKLLYSRSEHIPFPSQHFNLVTNTNSFERGFTSYRSWNSCFKTTQFSIRSFKWISRESSHDIANMKSARYVLWCEIILQLCSSELLASLSDESLLLKWTITTSWSLSLSTSEWLLSHCFLYSLDIIITYCSGTISLHIS